MSIIYTNMTDILHFYLLLVARNFLLATHFFELFFVGFVNRNQMSKISNDLDEV